MNRSHQEYWQYMSLTFNRQMGQCGPIKCPSFSLERENGVLQWEFKLKSTPSTVENWLLRAIC
jgi:hypothetical protein